MKFEQHSFWYQVETKWDTLWYACPISEKYEELWEAQRCRDLFKAAVPNQQTRIIKIEEIRTEVESD